MVRHPAAAFTEAGAVGARSSGYTPRECAATAGIWVTGTGGRYRTRTDDLFRVKEARYQLRQSPSTAARVLLKNTGRVREPHNRPFGDRTPSAGHGRQPPPRTSAQVCGRADTPQAGWNWLFPCFSDRVVQHAVMRAMRMWRSGSASPCQGEGREFESRHPLECGPAERSVRPGAANSRTVAWPRGEAAACKAVHTGSNPVATSNSEESEPCKSGVFGNYMGDWRSGSALP